MPIYEFYCPDCHTVFSFFSARIDIAARPACPQCGRPELGRRPSRFATVSRLGSGSEETEGESPIPGLDESRMEQAMEQLAGEMEGLGGMEGDESPDPRQLARFMRRFGEVSGLEPGPKLEEMLHQLENGADPDSFDDELGGDEGDDAAAFAEMFKTKRAAGGKRGGKPRIDDTLHFL
ncbi:MAG: zinc ribbon domain-containing protein [Holophagales bacterium]|nr:MAG: zinc ribbon domain-containing protein [Holophagales bacterium]